MLDGCVDRVFLGWDRPALVSAAAWLLSRFGGRPEVDLSDVVVVVPGGRAARNLRALLVSRAAAERTPLSPPRLLTPGQVADAALVLEGPCAGPVLRRLAWVEALRSVPEERLRALSPSPPREEDLPGWESLAAALERCHATLAGEGVRFADVCERAPGRCRLFDEEERWAAAAAVQDAYERLLEREGRPDPDLRRVRALEAGGVSEGPEFVLLGVADLPGVAREALRRVRARVTALVFAPERLSGWFDEFGCVEVEAWCRAGVAVEDSRIVFADSPAGQAERALEAVAATGGRLAADQITIGTPDETIVPYLQRQSEMVGGPPMRSAAGKPVRLSAPWRLLDLLADYAEEPTLGGMCALIRHPDVEGWLRGRLRVGGAEGEWWLDAIDCYRAEHLHGRVDGVWHGSDPGQQRALREVHGALVALMGELAPGAGERPLHEWAGPVVGVLREVYAARRFRPGDPHRQAIEHACCAIRDAAKEMLELGELPRAWGGRVPAWRAMRLVLEHAGEAVVPEDPEEGAIELLGWLELPLDPAESVIITGMNDGIVPAAFGADPFLPESLREALGIPASRHRFARDAYVLAAVVGSRPEVTVIAGRRSAENDPLWPSRLLLKCGAGELVRRLRRFAGQVREPVRVRVRPRLAPGEENRFPVAPMAEARAVESMSVTSFRTYLASPYAFYLEHVLGLRERGEPGPELDALAFGDLVHTVLDRFGRGVEKHSEDAARIERCFMDELDALAAARYGARPGPAIVLQVEIARMRLRELAAWQAERARGGWLIAAEPEWRPSEGRGVLVVDGAPVHLRGRIDRVERHGPTGRLAVLDFKTGESVRSPRNTHRGRDGWRDLQLPLYRHLAAELEPGEDVVLGYVAVPRQPGGVKLLEAGWSPAELAEADAAAAAVVRAVREGRFGSVGERPPAEGVFGALCGVGFLGVDGAEGEE